MSYIHRLTSEMLERAERFGEANYSPQGSLLELKEALERSVRGLGFCHRNNHSLYVYQQHCPYVLGWIGYGSFRDSNLDREWAVHARTIVNRKYADYSDNYHIKTTGKLDVALRNAKKYLRPYSPAELAKVTLHNARREVRFEVDKLYQGASKMYEGLMNGSGYHSQTCTSRLFIELRHLLTANHTFVDPAFGTELQEFFETYDTHKEYQRRDVPMWYVYVHERGGVQVCDVVSVGDARRRDSDVGAEWHRYIGDDVPEDIVGKVSVLNILEKDQYVEGVGLKVGEGMFYVAR